MDCKKYYEARNIVKDILIKDLMGPISEEEEICDYPSVYYIAGKLYPQDINVQKDNVSSEDVGELEEEEEIAVDNGRNPSSIGISFCVTKECNEIVLSFSAGKYNLVHPDEEKKEKQREYWKRKSVGIENQVVRIEDLELRKKYEIVIHNDLVAVVMVHKIYNDGSKTITVTMVNSYNNCNSRIEVNQHTYFQPKIKIEGKKTDFLDVRHNARISQDIETMELEMLYSKYANYVSGHGCASSFNIIDERIILQSVIIPFYELNQMMPALKDNDLVFSMKHLAEADKDEIVIELNDWIELYKEWIESCKVKIEELDSRYHVVAKKNIEKCEATYLRIKESISCLNDDDVYYSFRYANEVMFIQRKKQMTNRGKKIKAESIRWYPFQLAFFLQEIISFATPTSAERKYVDLLWFPTGGGKTEAYLGISAFVIFLRRLRNGDSGNGVTIFMRYTLRLLTYQQFERATAMICACELIRKKYKIPGNEISIGMWVGKALTPNTIESAQDILNGTPDFYNESSNPVQFEKCPWCGKKIGRENYYCDKSSRRMLIKCNDVNCEFSSGLPVYLIDEEIYTHKPTFLIATVDKFAQVAINEESFSLFGKNSNCLPPEMIIQDELHLISGPLGTITGVYEAAFKKMCENNGIGAKIIASTATIKNAKDQINSLYATDFTQFPPQGIDAENSYFAIKSTSEDKPSRMYLGCMASGTSAVTTMVRVMASTLFASRYLEAMDFDEEIIDSFWTITSYYNTLRELGGAVLRVVDNVQDRFAYLRDTKFINEYRIINKQSRYDNYKELTSREKSEDIGRVIQKELVIKYNKERTTIPYDFILASNMISVGIDIGRLNIMLMNGQPKTTAEYIQATSRVGRETPGLVITMYNYMRSRDKSHYEQFGQYHESFYKFVEATSVTPFAERARDRALHALYIMLCRFYIDELSSNDSAGNYRKDIEQLDDVKNYILSYVDIVDPNERENVEEELQGIELEWEELAREHEKLTYKMNPFKPNQPSLFAHDYKEESRFRILNSMRSVETMINVVTKE